MLQTGQRLPKAGDVCAEQALFKEARRRRRRRWLAGTAGGHYSLLAWLPADCGHPGGCPIKITNTATRSVQTVRSPQPAAGRVCHGGRLLG
jgi:hypothetical protein